MTTKQPKVHIKPCPFCGKAVEMDTVKKDERVVAYAIGHWCDKGARVIFVDESLMGVMKKWNRRMSDV